MDSLQMAEIILKVAVAFCLLILIHELGHFLVAKYLGIGVERFSIGFGPKIASVRRGETEYMLSVIPLGGYVKLIGDDPRGSRFAGESSIGIAGRARHRALRPQKSVEPNKKERAKAHS